MMLLYQGGGCPALSIVYSIFKSLIATSNLHYHTNFQPSLQQNKSWLLSELFYQSFPPITCFLRMTAVPVRALSVFARCRVLFGQAWRQTISSNLSQHTLQNIVLKMRIELKKCKVRSNSFVQSLVDCSVLLLIVKFYWVIREEALLAQQRVW